MASCIIIMNSLSKSGLSGNCPCRKIKCGGVGGGTEVDRVLTVWRFAQAKSIFTNLGSVGLLWDKLKHFSGIGSVNMPMARKVGT